MLRARLSQVKDKSIASGSGPMGVLHRSSDTRASASPKAKAQVDVREKQSVPQPSGSYSGGKTSIPLPSDGFRKARTRATLSAPASLQQSLGDQPVVSRVDSGLNPAALDHLFLLQPIIGNHGVARRLQTSLKVNTPGDQYEQEADRVAEQVMRMPAPTVAGAAISGSAAGVQLKAFRASDAGLAEVPPIVHEVLRSPGQPLDAGTRAFMEPRFGQDFRGVRVHTDATAADSARAVNARAYTAGSHVVFGAGDYGPGTHSGRRLIGHELAHVIQQDALNPRDGSLSATTLQRQPQHPAPGVAGGNILYIGMSANAPLEADTLRAAYRGKPVTVTAVTLSDTESKTKTVATGRATFDLTSDAGIDSFGSALNLTDQQSKTVGEILRQVPSVDRDDWAHVIAVYAQTDSDHKDRMSRVILSGHSGGVSVYSKEKKGEIEFNILATLSDVFPDAAGQTKHLMVAACFAGDEDTLLRFYQKAFPNLKTFAGWTWFSPTESGGARAVTGWAHTTDTDPANLPAPKSGEATWEGGVYQGANPRQAPADAVSSLHFQEQFKFDDYFTGDKVGEKYQGELPEYYARALSLANRQEITGPDHDYAQTQANRAFRLRFWKEQVAGFWVKFGPVIRKGYGSAKVPEYGHLSRKIALEQIAAFASIANGTTADQAEAQRLLNGLRDLDDPDIMDKTWQ